jgi:hypothetical protein
MYNVSFINLHTQFTKGKSQKCNFTVSIINDVNDVKVVYFKLYTIQHSII